ncbi:hypothetical protein H634G_11500, partial [Metarhizium anisopliae BRIP 53293]
MPGPFIVFDSLADPITESSDLQFDSTDAAFPPYEPPSIFGGVDAQLHWLDEYTPETSTSTPNPEGHFAESYLELLRENDNYWAFQDEGDDLIGTTPFEDDLQSPRDYKCRYDG